MNLSLPTITLVLAVLGLLAGIYCAWQITSLNKLRNNFFAGTKALDLESVILALQQEMQSGQDRQTILENAQAELRHALGFAVQKVGLVRFNPFEDGGGNFSFSLALLNAQDSGIVITSMHGREQNRIYTKKIINGLSDMKLTEEEEKAVQIADQKIEEPKTKSKRSSR
jgi:uncharacterized membrane protein